jgi:hypothetical protein
MRQLHSRFWQKAGPGAERGVAAFVSLGALISALAIGPAAHAAENGVTLSDPWMRAIMASRPSAGYFILSNETATARALVAAKSPACGKLMLHNSVSENGVDRMVTEKRIPLPPNGKLIFAPGGYHLMCISPTAAIKPGNSVPVTLEFEDGGTLTAPFPVRGVIDR